MVVAFSAFDKVVLLFETALYVFGFLTGVTLFQLGFCSNFTPKYSIINYTSGKLVHSCADGKMCLDTMSMRIYLRTVVECVQHSTSIQSWSYLRQFKPGPCHKSANKAVIGSCFPLETAKVNQRWIRATIINLAYKKWRALNLTAPYDLYRLWNFV